MLYIASNRYGSKGGANFDFYDANGVHLPLRQKGHPNAKVPPDLPVRFEEMKKLAEILSAGIPHVRVDFYEARGRVYFGEMTFFSMGGMAPYTPKEWDVRMGEWIDLRKIVKTK